MHVHNLLWFRRAQYAITNERVIFRNGAVFQSTKSINLKLLPVVTVVEEFDGTGTIVFREPKSKWGFLNQIGYDYMLSFGFGRTQGGYQQLAMIANVRSVYVMIQKYLPETVSMLPDYRIYPSLYY